MNLRDRIRGLNNDTGFGAGASRYGGRFVNRDGSFNLRREGVAWFNRVSFFRLMLHLPRWKFAVGILCFYIIVNLCFALIYFSLDASEFTGILAGTRWQLFKELYFFSTETFTTVGYGRVNPVKDLANLVSSIESMMGFLSFAVVTGLIYGRFSQPRSFLLFSSHALVAKYRTGLGLMFRFAPFKDHHVLTNVEVKVSLAMTIQTDGKEEYKFYNLSLERNRVDNLPMNWTVVHPIDEESPIFGFTDGQMRDCDVEVMVLVTGYDEIYASNVQQRTSYTHSEIVFDRRFVPMYRDSEDGTTTIVELAKLSLHQDQPQ